MLDFLHRKEDIDPAQLKAGDKMKDGTVYAGLSPTTHKPLFVAPQDDKTKMTFQAAVRKARTLTLGKHSDWRVPSEAELNLLQAVHDEGALRGTFNPHAMYWAAPPPKAINNWCQTIANPADDRKGRYSMDRESIRFVR